MTDTLTQLRYTVKHKLTGAIQHLVTRPKPNSVFWNKNYTVVDNWTGKKVIKKL